MYVIKRHEDGKYLATVKKPGGHSYGTRLESADKFRTREQAEREKCENEYVLALEDCD